MSKRPSLITPSSEGPISVGDLVYVARPCKTCGNAEYIGHIFRVPEICLCEGDKDCCGDDTPEWCAIDPADDKGLPLDELRRIPPLTELEGIKSEEDIREPA